jgi:hypothetical protein
MFGPAPEGIPDQSSFRLGCPRGPPVDHITPGCDRHLAPAAMAFTLLPKRAILAAVGD